MSIQTWQGLTMSVTKTGDYEWHVADTNSRRFWTVHYEDDNNVFPPDRWTITNHRGQILNRWRGVGNQVVTGVLLSRTLTREVG